MSEPKVALVTGITGQDGSYLARLLLKKGYHVHGVRRRSSGDNKQRIIDLIEDPSCHDSRFFLHYGDITDTPSLTHILEKVRPNEVYNLAAQSHVRVSFDAPEYTAQADAIGTLRILEAIRTLKLSKDVRFYQAATSEMYGKIQESQQSETTPFYPRSPYGVAKLYGYWITTNYREAYDFFATNGILFNHESPLRGDSFVTRKITKAAARIALGMQSSLSLGNLNAERDWGHTREYVEGMWRMLQHDHPEDFVLATGKKTSVRDFVKMTFSHLGFSLDFSGSNEQEVGICSKSGRKLVTVDPYYYRPTEVDCLLGNANKAQEKLGWKPEVRVEALCQEMVAADVFLAAAEKGLPVGDKNFLGLLESNGYCDWFEKIGRALLKRAAN